jgi:putative transposase
VDRWAHERKAKLHFIERGKQVQNAFIESFNDKMRDECLNEHWFLSLGEARETIEAWRRDYHEVQPDASLGNRPPQEFTGAGAGQVSPLRRIRTKESGAGLPLGVAHGSPAPALSGQTH